MRQTTLRRTARGYVRNLGRRPGYTGQEKFCLGYDKDEAETKLEKIAALWKQCEVRGGFWDDATLTAAKTIARGDEPDLQKREYEAPERYFQRVNEANGAAADPFMYEVGKADIVNDIARLQSLLTMPSGKQLTGQTLHQAIEAYRQYVRREYTDNTGAITDNGKTKLDISKSLLAYLPSLDLGELDFDACDQLAALFRRRPVSKRYGKPMARKSCINMAGELKRCLTWVHRSPEWRWRKPEDFESIKWTPRELDEDVEREAAEVPTWTVDELKTLYRYALPIERILMLLGLNCAYGADQAGRLKRQHLKLADGEPTHIRRIRRKKKTISFHRLWTETAKGLKWALGRAGEEFIFVTESGVPFWSQTKGGNRRQTIPNIWNRLLNRVQKDYPDFRRLPFNSLRDSSGNEIRKIAGEETALLHLAHKHQSADPNLRRYTNPVWKRLFKAHRCLERKLTAIWDGVDGWKEPRRAYIGLEMVDNIRKMKAKGMPILHIATELGVSQTTVYRWLEK